MSDKPTNKRRFSISSPPITPKRPKSDISKRAQTERKANKSNVVENKLCTPRTRSASRKSLLDKLAKTAPISRSTPKTKRKSLQDTVKMLNLHLTPQASPLNLVLGTNDENKNLCETKDKNTTNKKSKKNSVANNVLEKKPTDKHVKSLKKSVNDTALESNQSLIQSILNETNISTNHGPIPINLEVERADVVDQGDNVSMTEEKSADNENQNELGCEAEEMPLEDLDNLILECEDEDVKEVMILTKQSMLCEKLHKKASNPLFEENHALKKRMEKLSLGTGKQQETKESLEEELYLLNERLTIRREKSEADKYLQMKQDAVLISQSEPAFHMDPFNLAFELVSL